MTEPVFSCEKSHGFTCTNCGAPAVCLGSYEGDEWMFGCNACCKHGCEDGHCEPISAEWILSAINGAVDRAEAAERALDEASASVVVDEAKASR